MDGAGNEKFCLIRATSLTGVSPNKRLNSRLNCDTLSYPTLNAALLAEAPSAFIIRRASIKRRFFWHCKGDNTVDRCPLARLRTTRSQHDEVYVDYRM